MSGLMMCRVQRDGKQCKALFRGWVKNRFMPVVESVLETCPFGIVEFEEGNLQSYAPSEITFVDESGKEYIFSAEEVMR